MDRAVCEYNYAIHSETKKRPLKIFFGVTTDPEQYDKSRENNRKMKTTKHLILSELERIKAWENTSGAGKIL